MKLFISTVFAFCILSQVLAQENNRTLPAVELKTTEGKSFNTKDVSNNGKPTIISFWATWCKPCVNELNTLSELYIDWKEETGVNIIAVSIDDSRNTAKVAPFVNGREWEFDILLDANGDFKRAMNVNVIPHTFIINAKNEIVWQHNGYAPGDEKKLIETVREVIAGKEPMQLLQKH